MIFRNASARVNQEEKPAVFLFSLFRVFALIARMIQLCNSTWKAGKQAAHTRKVPDENLRLTAKYGVLTEGKEGTFFDVLSTGSGHRFTCIRRTAQGTRLPNNQTEPDLFHLPFLLQ